MEGEFSERASTSQNENQHESFENSTEVSSFLRYLNDSPVLNVSSNQISRKRKLESDNSESLISGESTPLTEQKHSRRNPHNPDNPPLDWQSTKPSLKDRTTYVFDNNLFCDVHFIVGEGPEAKRISAHRFVLTVGSSVFEAMFSEDWSSESGDIEVPDIDPDAFSAFLRYLYTDDVTLSAHTVMAILYAAKKYDVPSLQNQCLEFLLNSLNSDNAFTILTQSENFDAAMKRKLEDECPLSKKVLKGNSDTSSENFDAAMKKRKLEDECPLSKKVLKGNSDTFVSVESCLKEHLQEQNFRLLFFNSVSDKAISRFIFSQVKSVVSECPEMTVDLVILNEDCQWAIHVKVVRVLSNHFLVKIFDLIPGSRSESIQVMLNEMYNKYALTSPSNVKSFRFALEYWTLVEKPPLSISLKMILVALGLNPKSSVELVSRAPQNSVQRNKKVKFISNKEENLNL